MDIREALAELGPKLDNSNRKQHPLAGRPVSDEYSRVFGGALERKRRKVGRNEPCPCRSGLKYKRCCGQGK